MTGKSYLAGFDKKRSRSLRLMEYLVTGEDDAIEAMESLGGQEANVDIAFSKSIEGRLRYGVKLGR